jgi:GNAT superfamily N-acetyltransferase
MLTIQPFQRTDIPAALQLCAQVNWNHLAADWERCLTLNPAACIGGFEEGVLKATCTLTPFGEVGWVGTFLVDQSQRGQGYGKLVFEAMLAQARQQGLVCLGLDSSDAGRPIYLRYGFQMTGQGVELWSGPNPAPAHGEASAADVRPVQSADWEQLLALDRGCSGVDRARQLRTLAGEAGATAQVCVSHGTVQGFGFSRPGKLAGVIGPVVAHDLAAACQLMMALLADRRARDGEKTVALAVPDQEALRTWLAACGFQMRRRNLRMFRPAPRELLAGPALFVTTGLGMG